MTLLLLLLAVVVATTISSLVSASSSPLFDDFLAHFLHHGYLSPPEVDATDEFPNHCLQVKGDRLVVVKPESDAVTTFRPGSAFLATDLCAMGHTAKDAPLLLSWALDAESFSESEVMKDAFDAFCPRSDGGEDETTTSGSGCIVPSHRKEEQAELRHKKHSPPLRYVVYGNMCMSRDPSVLPNKRSPVFHKVLWSWFRAVTERLGALRSARGAGGGKKKDAASATSVEEIFLTGDFNGETKKYKTLCFENIVTRRERWRWLRDQFHTDQFRIAMWSHFAVSEKNQIAKKESGSSSSSVINNRLPPSLRFAQTMIHRLTPAGSTIANRLDDVPSSAAAIRLSLRSRFPSSLLPLRVTVLVRDEDRHFHEPRVGHFIQQRFGRDLVDVRLEKFDSIKGAKATYKPPSHPEQLQLLFDTDILIAAHGAGLAAVLAMRPGTAVVEFFPHNFKYFMYEEAAMLSRVFYRRYESPRVWPKRCCSVAQAAYRNFSKPMHLNGLGARACKKCDTLVTEEVVEELVAEAIRKVVLAHN